MWEEANQAFYEWEEETEQEGLTDEDRILWCEGYMYARRWNV